MFRPIGRLHDAISQVGQNDLQVQVAIEEDRRDELSELAQQFNRMVLSLRRNQQALLENQQALNDAQIRMLQAQLNPHFLCNTLDTMKWISKINQVPQVALMSTNLADILRFCILPDEFVPLEKELQILGRYVEIQRIRLSDSFTYEQTVPEALLSCMVPKMMLQPLAENAILHGLSGVPDGKLTVEARELEDETLEIRVCDNGAGLPEALLGPYRPPEKQTRHLGLLMWIRSSKTLRRALWPASGQPDGRDRRLYHGKTAGQKEGCGMMRVLVVEDEEMIRKGIVLATDWQSLGCVVVGEAANGEEGIAQAEKCRPSLIITDLKMPKMDGLEMIAKLREAGCDAYIIILTAYDSFTYAQTALRLGAVDFLLKPFHDGDLENAVLALQKS